MPPMSPKPPESSSGYDPTRPFFQKVFPAPGETEVPPKKPPYGSTVTKAMAYANEQAGRSADILAVRAALAAGKTLTLQQARKEREDREKMPPPSVPPKQESPTPRPVMVGARKVSFSKVETVGDAKEQVFRPSKFGSPDPGRPEIGEEGNFGGQFQDMKKKVTRMEGESRKAYKARVHASSGQSTREASQF